MRRKSFCESPVKSKIYVFTIVESPWNTVYIAQSILEVGFAAWNQSLSKGTKTTNAAALLIM